MSPSPSFSPSPYLHVTSTIRFGIEGTVYLEPIAAALNDRPPAPEGVVSDAVKFDPATHTVSIYKVSIYSMALFVSYHLYVH